MGDVFESKVYTVNGSQVMATSSMSHQNPPSAEFRLEHLAETRAPKPDLLSQRWTCSFLKHCAKRANAMQMRSPLFIDFTSIL